MGFVNASTATPRPDLIAAMILFASGRQPSIGHLLAPPMMVAKKSDNIDVLPVTATSMLPNTKRAAGAGANRITWGLDTDSYTSVENAIASALPDAKKAERSNIDPEAAESMAVYEIMRRAYEKRVADLLINTTNFPLDGVTGTTITTPWDNASATPAADVAAGLLSIFTRTGCPASMVTLELSYETWTKLPFVTDVRARMQITTEAFAGQLSPEALAVYFGVGRVVIGGMAYNSANIGQTASLSGIWNADYATLIVPGFAYGNNVGGCCMTFVWDEPQRVSAIRDAYDIDAAGFVDSALGIPINIESFRDEDASSDVFRATHWTHEKLLSNRYGYLLYNTKT